MGGNLHCKMASRFLRFLNWPVLTLHWRWDDDAFSHETDDDAIGHHHENKVEALLVFSPNTFHNSHDVQFVFRVPT